MTLLRKLTIGIAALLLCLSPIAAQAASKNFTAHLSGKEMVPQRDTNASAQVKLGVSSDNTQLQYRINAGNIENVIWAKLFVGAPGTPGVEVATLYGPVPAGGGKASGVLTQGTLTADKLVGSLAGHPLSDLITEMTAGNTFVVIATDDGAGVPDEKSGDFASGEIRGQIK